MRTPLLGRKLGDDQGIRTHQDPSIPMRPEALSCRDWFHSTSRRSVNAVRDEEVVGSNPATPTIESAGQRPRSPIGTWPLWCELPTHRLPAKVSWFQTPSPPENQRARGLDSGLWPSSAGFWEKSGRKILRQQLLPIRLPNDKRGHREHAALSTHTGTRGGRMAVASHQSGNGGN